MSKTWDRGNKFDSKKYRREAKKMRERQLKILRKNLKREGKDVSAADELLFSDDVNYDEYEEH